MYYRANEENPNNTKMIDQYVVGGVDDFFIEDIYDTGFESREGQQTLALDIAEAMRDNHHIVAEAGVGIGKSFAYIVPLLLYHRYRYRNSYSSIAIVISTATIALQEQLKNDIEKIQSIIGYSCDIVLAKGQSHFICIEKTEQYLVKLTRQDDMNGINNILLMTKKGVADRKDFTTLIDDKLWNKINVSNFNYSECSKCTHKNICYFFRLRQEMKNTKGIIICNHDLLTVSLKKEYEDQRNLLPSHIPFMVLDEVHNLENIVRSSLTQQFSKENILKTSKNANKIIKDPSFNINTHLKQLEESLTKLFGHLNESVDAQIKKNADYISSETNRFYFYCEETEIHISLKNIVQILSTLHEKANISYAQLSDNEERRLSLSISDSIDEQGAILAVFKDLNNIQHKNIYWIEKKKSLLITSCPKNVNELIYNLFFNQNHIMICTSATITGSIAGDDVDKYGYFIKNTGFPLPPSGILAPPQTSPFPYNKHSLLYFSDDLPNPTHEKNDFIKQGVDRILDLLEISNGKTLILFTSKKDMKDVYAKLKKDDLSYEIYHQQDNISQEETLQKFKEDINSVLLATGTFWEGINIEGIALTQLIIFKLPFPVPDPILDYKSSLTKNDFMEVYIPEMIIKLKQGVGRLIRNSTDKGIVSILDSRLSKNKGWENKVFDVLPMKNKTSLLTEVRQFYNSVVETQ